MAYRKSGTPFLYSSITSDIVGIVDPDGSEKYFVTATPATSQAAALNWKESNTRTLRYMVQASGYERSILLVNGDSLFQARKAAGNGDIGARKFALAPQLAAALTANGYAAQADSVAGWLSPSPNSAAGYIAYDPRVAYSGTVISTPGYAGLGYQMWQIPAAGTVTFTPGGTFDTIDVFWPALAGAGTFTVSDGGGVKATIDSSATPGSIRSQTVTLAAGTTAVTFTSTSGNSNIAFWKVRTAAAPGIEVVMSGGAGLPVQQWAPTAVAAPYGTQASIDALTSGLKVCTIQDGWYNDFAASRTLAQYSADLRTVLAYEKTKGDVIFVNYGDLVSSNISQTNYDAWSSAARDIVINEFDLPWIDMSQIVKNNAQAVTAGILDTDTMHFRKPGHTMMRDAVMTQILAMI